MRKSLIMLSLAAFASSTMVAQELPRFTFNVGGGFTQPTEQAGDRLDRGWNASLGAGYRFHPNFALKADFSYNRFGINQATLTDLGFPGGNARMWSATLNPEVHISPRGPVDVYFTAGGGLYQWRHQFTQPTTATFTAFDPYFGIFFPVAVPVDQVLVDYTVNKPGFNGGMGFAFGTRWNVKVYTEARFQRMIFGANRYVDSIPVTFGLRW